MFIINTSNKQEDMGCFGKTLLLLWAAARAHRITNGRVAADVSDAGFLTSITDEDGYGTALARVAVEADGFLVEVTAAGANATLTPATCAVAGVAASPASVVVRWACGGGAALEATYAVVAAHVEKTVAAINVSAVGAVAPLAGLRVAGTEDVHVAENPYNRTHRYATGGAAIAAVANPFFNVDVDASFGLTLRYDTFGSCAVEGGAYAAEPAVLGATRLQRYAYGPVNLGERAAFVACVEAYLLDGAMRKNATVKVNVAWDESDYQLDVATAEGRAEYDRIFASNAALGITHVLLAFLAKSGAAGFAWDQDIFAGAPELRYGQWRSWMAILRAIRAAKPDAVMDHRQTNHVWGPWYQLAGSYAEPLAGDENPETYGVPIANLHADHVAADNLRRVNYAYAAAQLLPPSRVPGFIFHQAERTDDNGTDACFGGVPWRDAACYDVNARDFDYVGYKYSVLASVGSAGLNNVVAFLPGRDAAEWAALPDGDKAWIRGWLAWTDDEAACLARALPVATLGPPAVGAVDGWACFDAARGVGFVFLFNPGFAPRSAGLALDESLGVANGTAALFRVDELHPGRASLGTWRAARRWRWPRRGALSGSRRSRSPSRRSRSRPSARPCPSTRPSRPSPSTASPAPSRRRRGPASSPRYAAPASRAQRAMPVAPGAVAPPAFAGGWFNATVAVPAAVAPSSRPAAAYDVAWRPGELRAAFEGLFWENVETPPDDARATNCTFS
ncbi:hypothetical protein JL722_10404 [Aureococcus anophagefferens]|nr:hypothetical protein JL722_10404 [Aureococcus anophagefferens]